MQRQFQTQGIVLTRVDFQEADRILTFLTPEHGKVSAIAKGVRKSKSKLAGGIELFSVSDLSFIKGRGTVDTLISSRLLKHYGHIVKNLGHTSAGYEMIRMVNKATEEAPEPAYFLLLDQGFAALDDLEVDAEVTRLWFGLHLLKLAGHTPDLHNDLSGEELESSKNYSFHLDAMKFEADKGQGGFTANHIKFLRLGLAAAKPQILQKVEGAETLTGFLQPLVQSMLKTFVRI